MVPYRRCHWLKLYSVTWQDDSEQRTGKVVVTFIEVPSQNLPGGTEENQENLQSEYSMTRPRFKPGSS